jgi:hypothetical protein
MPGEFPYDVFLSHSAKDKRSKPPTLMHDTGGNAAVRDVAKRLRKDGPMPKAEGRRTKAEVPLHPFPDWAQLESGTFRFRDLLNKERRFLPLCLDGGQHSNVE